MNTTPKTHHSADLVTVYCDRCDHETRAPFWEIPADLFNGEPDDEGVYIRCTAWPATWPR